MSTFAEEHKKEADRRTWVKGLKPGDTVCVVGSGSGYNAEDGYQKDTVTRVTPTGKVRLSNGDLFDDDGTRRDSSGFRVRRWHLEPWTKDIEHLLSRRKLLSEVSTYLDYRTIDVKLVAKASDDDLVILRTMLQRFAHP